MARNSGFNELTRVQMPAMVHLTRLGYEYIGKLNENMAGTVYDPDTNILINVFKEQFAKLNPENAGEAEEVLRQIRQELDNDDLGQSFYKRLTRVAPIKLIDFDNIHNNIFQCTGEFTCKRDNDEFRPDLTLFVNGLPLVFIEVKKPNNTGGMLAESLRMSRQRFPNKKFRRFINITQLMIFSNNMEYDAAGGIIPIQGVFYCTAAHKEARFNCFREDNYTGNDIAPYIATYPYDDIDPAVERKILSDFNCQVIHTASEYQTNLNINTPTNRTITSMCNPERLLFLLRYGFAYYHSEREVDGKMQVIDEKHIMRYPQFFASLAIRSKLENGVNSGVIWHTQGSGKTALSYHLTKVLQDYFSEHNKVAKFYFIVDRLDLLEQASQEFHDRGLIVKTASTRQELMEQFRTNQALEGASGEAEITVVNIQRFAEDHEKVKLPDYATNLQRVFIIDEAHRGYNPKGSFLANLFDADKDSVKIALTGTPLLKEERSSWKVFGEYLHTYYYDKSVQDGYTLKIIREDIKTQYKESLQKIYDSLDSLVQKKDVKKNYIIEHERYVKELLRYIINDLKQFRIVQGDDTLGGMIVCETSEQARKIYALFDEVQKELNENASKKTYFKVGLILHDSDDKETRKQIVKDFKKNMTIDILVVFNMLLTGFDAPRLKKLYLGRKLKDHNLLQAITRVNRPYKEHRYGYIVDFADIKKNFEETNEAYLKELNRFNEPEVEGGAGDIDLFKKVMEDKDSLIKDMKAIYQRLYNFTLDDAEQFSVEVSSMEDKEQLTELRKVLEKARDCYNIVRTYGDDELKAIFEKMKIERLPQMISEVQRCISNITQKEAFAEDETIKQNINAAMQSITFNFQKLKEEELKLISGGMELQEKWQRTIHAFTENTDQDDPEFITLREAFMQRFKEHGFEVKTIDEFNAHARALDEILAKLNELRRKNNAMLKKYKGDAKFARVHKRIREANVTRGKEEKEPIISTFDLEIQDVLSTIKDTIDQQVYDRNDILKKDAYFEKTVMSLITQGFKKFNGLGGREARVFIQTRITKEYLNQYKDTYEYA